MIYPPEIEHVICGPVSALENRQDKKNMRCVSLDKKRVWSSFTSDSTLIYSCKSTGPIVRSKIA